ncbi:acetoacetyl-CoA synthetase [Caerostris extrusa]|uniref:Acetoacetyl-CoA synthetase n=1 Tax=Caerostris extrusa TaxID=172846 RepID=A0AAV4TGG3_CAEEX|nr:acetoacetyl-CoA synthetase [Caerostris extrusa]
MLNNGSDVGRIKPPKIFSGLRRQELLYSIYAIGIAHIKIFPWHLLTGVSNLKEEVNVELLCSMVSYKLSNFRKIKIKVKTQVQVAFISDEAGFSESVTYAEMFEEGETLAAAFRKHGLKTGDRVACYLSNRKEAIFANLAAVSIGAVFGRTTTVFGSYDEDMARIDQQAANIVAKLEPKFLICIDHHVDTQVEFHNIDHLEHIVERVPDFGESHNCSNYFLKISSTLKISRRHSARHRIRTAALLIIRSALISLRELLDFLKDSCIVLGNIVQENEISTPTGSLFVMLSHAPPLPNSPLVLLYMRTKIQLLTGSLFVINLFVMYSQPPSSLPSSLLVMLYMYNSYWLYSRISHDHSFGQRSKGWRGDTYLLSSHVYLPRNFDGRQVGETEHSPWSRHESGQTEDNCD